MENGDERLGETDRQTATEHRAEEGGAGEETEVRHAELEEIHRDTREGAGEAGMTDRSEQQQQTIHGPAPARDGMRKRSPKASFCLRLEQELRSVA